MSGELEVVRPMGRVQRRVQRAMQEAAMVNKLEPDLAESVAAAVARLTSITGLIVWLARPQHPTTRDIDLDRQWTEIQLERLARKSRAHICRAADEARCEQPERGL